MPTDWTCPMCGERKANRARRTWLDPKTGEVHKKKYVCIECWPGSTASPEPDGLVARQREKKH